MQAHRTDPQQGHGSFRQGKKLLARHVPALLFLCTLMLCTSCEGIFNGIYDEPGSTAPKAVAGRIYMDATSWTDWYYIDFDSLLSYSESGDTTSLLRMQTHFQAYPIPDADSKQLSKPDSVGAPGIYTYWFDVFDKGLEVNKFHAYRSTALQQEPPSWSIAIHRDNVRTNGGEALETAYNDLKALPPTSKEFLDSLAQAGVKPQWQADEWTENAVWTDRSQMLSCYIGSQGIRINKVLSSWFSFQIPPIPPTSTYNGHVFILRLRSGRFAALRLANYMNDAGTKCWMTIAYKYPY